MILSILLFGLVAIFAVWVYVTSDVFKRFSQW